MTKPIDIAAHESGLVRVFALSLDETAAQRLKDNSPVNGTAPQDQALGGTIDSTRTEVFALSDLGDMSLPDYLLDGAGVKSKPLEKDRAKLAALGGWVLIVYSSAFGDAAQTLTPAPELTLIGTSPQEGVDWRDDVDLSTPSALPYQDTGAPARKRPSDAAMSGRVATAALLVLFALVGLMVWVAG